MSLIAMELSVTIIACVPCKYKFASGLINIPLPEDFGEFSGRWVSREYFPRFMGALFSGNPLLVFQEIAHKHASIIA
jgi:hypothetical protein